VCSSDLSLFRKVRWLGQAVVRHTAGRPLQHILAARRAIGGILDRFRTLPVTM
jgi:hypothetical protein